MAGGEQVNHYRKATFILSVGCTLLLISNLYLLRSADPAPTQVPAATVDYGILHQSAGNLRKYASGPEGIDRLAENSMLLTRFITDMQRSGGLSSDVEFMLYHVCISLL